MMNINSYYPTGGSFSHHQPLALHDSSEHHHQLSNGFHHSVSAAGFMSPTHYSGRAPICPGYDLPGSQTKARFVADGDAQLMRSAAADVVNAAGGSTREQHQSGGGYASIGDPAPHHPHVHHHLHHQQQPQQQQGVSRWGIAVDGGSNHQGSTTPPPLMPTSAFNPAVQSVTHHLSRPVTTDTSPPAVSCQSPHSAAAGFSSAGHIPFYPWMGVVGKCDQPRSLLFVFFFSSCHRYRPSVAPHLHI